PTSTLYPYTTLFRSGGLATGGRRPARRPEEGDAAPRGVLARPDGRRRQRQARPARRSRGRDRTRRPNPVPPDEEQPRAHRRAGRSEEHTSELQSPYD